LFDLRQAIQRHQGGKANQAKAFLVFVESIVTYFGCQS